MYSQIEIHSEYLDENIYLVYFFYKGKLIHKELVSSDILESPELKTKFLSDLFNKEVPNGI